MELKPREAAMINSSKQWKA